jgi:hypothetical protein
MKDVRILNVDGVKVKEGWLRTTVQVLPGSHESVVMLTQSAQDGLGTTLKLGELVAVHWYANPGSWYVCKPELDDETKTWKPVIDDVTDQRSAGKLDGIASDVGY